MWITAFFTDNSVPATGLSPTIRIRDVDDGSLIITDASMIEKGDGFYAYDFTTYDSESDYTIRCDGGAGLGDSERYTFASTGEYVNDINIIKEGITDIDVRTTLLRKLQTNRLELSDGDSNNWVLFDDDDVSTLLTFSVTDKDGSLIIQSPNIPSRRSRGI